MRRLTKAEARKKASVIFFSFLFSASVVRSKTKIERRRVTSASAPTRNGKIMEIVREIDARNIERTIRKLVSFGTRNTLSEQDNPNRGIGAARDWLYGEFQKAAQQSG